MPARSHGRQSAGEKGRGHIRYTSILSMSMSKWRTFMQLSLDGWMDGGMNEGKKVWTEREGREDWWVEGCWKDEW